MSISTDDIKIRESQNLSDDDEGGGYMTSTEIVDGSVNNLFDDISRLDRTYGRVSLRKFYMHVDTDDTSSYYGSHMILSKQAADPNIIVTLFSTDSDSDTREDAVDRLESYVTLGTVFSGWLYGTHPEGSRTLSVFAPLGTDSPDVNDVWCLFENLGETSEYYQYVRITDVESEDKTFTVDGDTFSKTVFTLTISDSLESDFTGASINNNDATASTIYTTTVSDAAEYFGVMTPTDDIASGDTTILVDDIYAQIVPTSQTETSLTDQTPGAAEPVQQSGETTTYIIDSFVGTSLYLNGGVYPGTLTLTIAGLEYTEQSDGILMQSSNQAGTIDYATGVVTFSTSKSGSGSAVYDPGVGLALVAKTLAVEVPTTGQGYTYVANMYPLPEPDTVTVDYMVDGSWYRLSDDGTGVLVPSISGTGTGTINYTTGTMSLTCAAIPDSDSLILCRWGQSTEVVQLAGNVEIEVEEQEITLSEFPVAPSSLTITWSLGDTTTATATDDGSGNITGDATGTIVYGTGALKFTPTEIPVSGSEMEIDYSKYAAITETPSSSTSFTLESAPKPGTVALDVALTVGGISHTYEMRDDASGNLSADGFTQIVSQCRSCNSDSSVYDSDSTDSSEDSDSYSLDSTEETVKVSGGSISGTIDYVTGGVVLDLTGATAKRYTVSATTKTTKADSETSEDVTYYSSVSIN